jgi:transposase-like protein
MSIPTLARFNVLMPDDEACIKFLLENDVFYPSIRCNKCDRPMRRIEERRVFRCQTGSCGRREESLRKHTFFFGSSLKCVEIMRLAHLWLSGISHQSTMTLLGHSPNTVTVFFKHFRKLVSSALTEEDQVIGGPGIIVEVDETKLGKRKYQRGHRVEGCWVVVGIERTPEAKVFLVPVEERSSETLTSILRRYVAPHSIVYTDCWKGYLGIQYDLEVSHATVNHSKFFKDPATQVCTNKAEGLNNGLKMKISPRNRVKDNMEEHLLEYVWRKKNQSCLWSSFIEALRDIHYDSE